ncbi:unnamed protein product [Mesocestoides corti]|uniref:HIT-type domain-containing protein n=1 Tax=Mesocestoides corti TaxID=53468 RepID=A0A0R3UQI9_MESCO|nr:unnamed protein product [Mesocestoides corti]
MEGLPKVQSLCEICETAPWIYKCSKCFLKHCSLGCYNKHKSTCVSSVGLESKEEEEAALVPLDLGDNCSDYIPTRILENLQNSKRLKELLSNRHLRRYLTCLDSSRHPAAAIEKAMKEPLFIEFADECLRVINQPQSN